MTKQQQLPFLIGVQLLVFFSLVVVGEIYDGVKPERLLGRFVSTDGSELIVTVKGFSVAENQMVRK